MAYPVHAGERATGYGVALLNTLFGNYTGASLLQEACPLPMANGDEESKSKKARKK